MMKKLLLLTLLFSLTTQIIKAQFNTDILLKVYVLNGPQCNHTYYGAVQDSVFGTFSLVPTSVDTFTSVHIYNFIINQSSANAQYNFCAVPAPPCTCPVQCTGIQPLGLGGAVTILLCGNTTEVENIITPPQIEQVKNKFFNSDVIKFSFDECELGNCYYVFNTMGSLVKSGIIETCDFTLDLRNLPFGLYLLKTTPKQK